MPKLHILRGASGSGKTSASHELVLQYFPAVVVSADLYFIRPDGQYRWYGQELPAAHSWCQREFEDALRLRYLVVVDNTNTKIDDMRAYVLRGEEEGYDIRIQHIKSDLTPQELAARNQHGVPQATIERQLRTFQELPEEWKKYAV